MVFDMVDKYMRVSAYNGDFLYFVSKETKVLITTNEKTNPSFTGQAQYKNEQQCCFEAIFRIAYPQNLAVPRGTHSCQNARKQLLTNK